MRQPKQVLKYGLLWSPLQPPVAVEMHMVQNGGQWPLKNGKVAGEGLFHHYKAFIQALWPHIIWHKWIDLVVKEYLDHRSIAILGPASAGKTFDIAVCVLADYLIFPETTTVLVCSTTKELLEQRIWGEIKELHKLAKRAYSWMPGHLIEGRLRIVTDARNFEEGRNFKSGLLGVPAKKGNDYVGLADFAGVKNKRVRIVGDELSMLPAAFIHAISNLDKNPDFKACGLGNPKSTLDALGLLAEPAAHLGGWDGGIDQTPGTKTWATRRPNGIAIQLPGDDSPNLDGTLGCDLITQAAIDADKEFYGTDSEWYTMMDLGRMPRGQGSRRVLTRQMALKFHAFDEPQWANTSRTRLACLDAAYRGVGGDRCVLCFMEFGDEVPAVTEADLGTGLISQVMTGQKKRQIVALNETMLVPVNVSLDELPEDQIVQFVMEECESRGIPPENFFFDAGMKTSLVQAFSRLWSSQVQSIDFGGDPSDRKVSAEIDVVCKDYYSKFVTELWFSVRLTVEAGQFRGMTEGALMEFCQREWGRVGKNKIEVETKEKTKVKTGRSPDEADTVAIGIEGARRLGFIIQKMGTDKRQRVSDEWKQDVKERAQELWHGKSLNYAA